MEFVRAAAVVDWSASGDAMGGVEDAVVPASRVTIRDVARAAGVSRQTVTRAINGMPEISVATRKRVMQRVEELGYRPNRFAIDLSRQRTLAVGLVVGTFRNPYYAQLADAFVYELRSRGCQVVIGTSDRDERDALRAMSSQVDAIVGYFEEPQEELARAVRGVPIVVLERRADHPGIHSVEIDLETGIEDLVTQLRGKGSGRFSMIDAADRGAGPDRGTPRRHYFEAAVGEPCNVVTELDSIAGGADGFRQLVGADPGIDTILAFNDLMAMGAVQGAHTLGVDVPGEVRVVGIDGLSLGEAISPTLTTLSLDSHAVAVEAASILSELFAREPARQQSINRAVTPVVLWRASA